MKLIILVALLFAYVNCQSATVTLGDLQHQSNLTINLDPYGSLTWSFASGTSITNNYAVLGSQYCLPAVRMVMGNGSFLAWGCDANQTGNGDQLINAIGGCSNTLNVPTFTNATGNLDFKCYHDNDTLGDLKCPTGDIGLLQGTWGCSIDRDDFAAAGLQCQSLGISHPVIAEFFPNGTFGCNPNYLDNDIARDLIPKCSNGQIIKYNGSAWTCGHDNSLLPDTVCPVGSTLVFNLTGNSKFSCGTETDTLRDLIPLCIAQNGTTPFRSNNCTNLNNCVQSNSTTTYWNCIPTPVSHQNPTLSMTTFTASVSVLPSSTYPTGTGYTGLGGTPFSTPYKGAIVGWALHAYQTGPVVAKLYLNNVVIDTINSTLTSPFLVTHPNLNTTFTPYAPFGFQIVNGAAIKNVFSVDIFVSWTL